MSNLLKCALGILLVLTGCSAQSSSIQVSSPNNSLGQESPNSPSTSNSSFEPFPAEVKADLNDYDVISPIRVTLPDGVDVDGWIIKKGKPTQGVVVLIGGRLVMLHDPLPQSGVLVGPWPGPVQVETRDLDYDGTKEILIRGDGGNGPGIWVYHYESTVPGFAFQGDLHGDGLDEFVDPDGAVRFEVISIRSTTDRRSVSTFWRWKPGGFYQVE